ncbi:hypothetical protein Tco_0126661 [Tanacetum coccineum]
MKVVGFTHEKTVLRTPHKCVVEGDRIAHLVEAARTIWGWGGLWIVVQKSSKLPCFFGQKLWLLLPGPAHNLLTPGPISSGLVPNPPPAPYVPPTNKELEILFQPMFDEYFETSTVDRQVPPSSCTQSSQSTLSVHQYPSLLIKRHHREVIHHHLWIINPLQYIKVLQLSILNSFEVKIPFLLADDLESLEERLYKQGNKSTNWRPRLIRLRKPNKKKSKHDFPTKKPPTWVASSTTSSSTTVYSAAPGSSKTAASTTYIAWTTTTSRLKSATSYVPEDVLMYEESDFEANDMGSNDEDSGSRHIPKVSLNQEWFKPLSEEERPATPKPVWSIPSSSLPVPNNNWASAIASSFQGITMLTPEHLEGPTYKVVKAFHPDVIHLQFQMEECHKLLTNQVDEGLLRYNVSRPLPLGGPPGQVTIQTEFFFNKDLEYLRFGHKGDRLALSITKMKAASYPDAGLEQMVPDQMWAEEEYMYDISASYGISHWWFKRQQFYIERHSADTNRRAIVKTHMRILSVVRIEVFSLYGSPEPPTAQRQEDSLYCRQLMDKEFGYQKMGRRLPARHRELPDSAEPHQTSLGSYSLEFIDY